MNMISRNLRFFACVLLALGLLVLGANGAAWAAPAQAPAGQTVPTRTPGNNPDATATPTNTPGNSSAATATPTNTPGNSSAATATPTSTAPQPGAFPCALRPADPPANAPRIVREAVNATAALTIFNCPWTVEIQAGDITQNGTLEAKLILASASQAPTAGERFFGPHVELTLFDTNGQPIAKPSFAHPITLCFNYTSADLAAIGDPAAFAIELFNPDTRQWERLPSMLDQANSRVCTQLPHLSLYGLAARVPQPSSLPNTGAPDQPGAGVWVWALLALALGAGIKARAMQRAAEPTPSRD